MTRWLTRGRREPESKFAAFLAAVETAPAAPDVKDDGPMGMDEFRVVVSRAVRRGVIPAMRLYWQMLRADRAAGQSRQADALAFADELARPP